MSQPGKYTNGAVCQGCRHPLPKAFLDLGDTPLANSFLRPEDLPEKEPVFRLAAAFCPQCFLVQLTDLVPPEKMFSQYLYFSSYSESFLAHAREMAEFLTKRFGLNGKSLVVEAGSNDGYLLQYFREKGIRVLGIEPAENVAETAVSRGVPTLNRFFGPESVPEILERFGRPSLFIGNNVLAHVPAVNEFLSAAALCLEENGAASFEFPYLRDLLDKTEFDTIYHEHVFYFSLHAVKVLAQRAGLELFGVSRQPVHGGSFRVLLGRPGRRPVEPAVDEMLREETEAGLTLPDRYARFSADVSRLRKQITAYLGELKKNGCRIAAYGAPAKGNTLLNTCGIGRNLLEFTVDKNRHKQGLLTPGSRLPIRPPEDLLKEMPDYALILPWNLAEEIAAQQEAYRKNGGKFIVPVPYPMEVSSR